MTQLTEEPSTQPELQESVDTAATSSLSRRSFVRVGAMAMGALSIADSSISASSLSPFSASGATGSGAQAAEKPALGGSTFLELIRNPDQITVFERFEKTLPSGQVPLIRNENRWTCNQVEIPCSIEQDSLTLSLQSPSRPIVAVHVRWRMRINDSLLVLGDAWERSYGELGWRNLIPERVMPWYFATCDRKSYHGYGVKTDATTLCFWQLDPDGVSLWLNTANGGNAVQLGDRKLKMATVVTHCGEAGVDGISSVAALCRKMCARKSRPFSPIYGANDWNYSYGHSTAETIVRDTEFIVELSPSSGVRPFSVIDGGWEPNTPAWPNMGKLAADIKKTSAQPGIWIRPLEAPKGTPKALLIPEGRFGDRQDRAGELAFDPTHPEARDRIAAKVQEVVKWGYEMIKHDFSTYDLLGQWGFEMGPQPTIPGWSLHDRSRTNAEVVADLYGLIRETAGASILIDGCNTIGHFGQGIFDMQRIGDDTSGRQWERTRRMGVNSLSFRLPQQGTFFSIDPDIVGITDAIPWELNRQWLDVLARSGAATIIAPGPPARGQEQRAAIREAFATAAKGGADARPVDWINNSAPEHWHASSSGSNPNRRYNWNDLDGASPFLSS